MSPAQNVSVPRNALQIIVRLSQNDLEMEAFQIYTTGQSKIAIWLP